MINVKCPHCQAEIRCDDRYAGRIVLCPTCKNKIQMPAVAQPLPVQRAPSHSSPPLSAAAHQPDPSPTDQQDFSWMSGESQGASSHRPTSRTYVPRKKKKTNPTLYIVVGVIGLVAVVGIGLFAGGVFSPQSQVANRRPPSNQTAPVPSDSKRKEEPEKPRTVGSSEDKRALAQNDAQTAKDIKEPKSTVKTAQEAREELQARIDRYRGGQSLEDLFGGTIGMWVVNRNIQSMELVRVVQKYDAEGKIVPNQFVAAIKCVASYRITGERESEEFAIKDFTFCDGAWQSPYLWQSP